MSARFVVLIIVVIVVMGAVALYRPDLFSAAAAAVVDVWHTYRMLLVAVPLGWLFGRWLYYRYIIDGVFIHEVPLEGPEHLWFFRKDCMFAFRDGGLEIPTGTGSVLYRVKEIDWENGIFIGGEMMSAKADPVRFMVFKSEFYNWLRDWKKCQKENVENRDLPWKLGFGVAAKIVRKHAELQSRAVLGEDVNPSEASEELPEVGEVGQEADG
ncbi:hypothetical protein TALC_00404 [Thermoplasmatales archaeon BRNA1]|nr:hypothetical protein TALC_00404 [Thermoplasmatales archaeon BRNA1]